MAIIPAGLCRRRRIEPLFAHGLAGHFNHNSDVLTLNPTLVEMETLDTQSLLERARGGDADAFCELCRSHEERLLRHAFALCGNATFAEDLAQDTLVEAWKSVRRFHGRCRFFTWLCAILLNRYRNALRKERFARLFMFSTQRSNEFQNLAEHLPDHGPGPDETAEQHERAAFIHQCIRALPRKHREVIHLRFYVDDSLEGIATALGCSVGTVKSRLFHALEKLRGMKAMSELLRNLKINAP